MKNMVLLATTVASLALAAVPAAAANLISSPIAVTSGDVGKSFTYSFDGFVNGNVQTGLGATATFTLKGVAGNVWTFEALFDNDGPDDGVTGRISGFGFDGNPEIVDADYISGPFTGVVLNASFPQIGGQTSIDFCFTANNNCNGGGGGGIDNGNSAIQEFTLGFTANPTNSVTFDNFVIRWQSIAGSQFGDSGIGRGTGTGGFDGGGGGDVPEPATWAMLLTGFGMVGFAARRRRGAQSVSA